MSTFGAADSEEPFILPLRACAYEIGIVPCSTRSYLQCVAHKRVTYMVLRRTRTRSHSPCRAVRAVPPWLETKHARDALVPCRLVHHAARPTPTRRTPPHPKPFFTPGGISIRKRQTHLRFSRILCVAFPGKSLNGAVRPTLKPKSRPLTLAQYARCSQHAHRTYGNLTHAESAEWGPRGAVLGRAGLPRGVEDLYRGRKGQGESRSEAPALGARREGHWRAVGHSD